ncbi:unnamed protein product, partial [marine sediment metagenome]
QKNLFSMSVLENVIVVDLQNSYLLDSIYLNIQGFDSWNQTFNLLVSDDSVDWYLVTSEVDTTGIFTYPLRTWNIVTVHDTVTTTIENHISVTDTLIIDALLTGIAGPDNINTLTEAGGKLRNFDQPGWDVNRTGIIASNTLLQDQLVAQSNL